MEFKDILKKCDHTLLTQTSTWEEIKELCEDAIKYQTASVCIPPCYVKQAKEYVGERLKICTVVGFPNGNSTSASKEFEAKDALANGADEIDMVINIGALKERNDVYVLDEIKTLKTLCGEKILKVIIETCLLNDEEKIRACSLATEAGADYVKTSTGFSTGGATKEDVVLMREHSGKNLKIKAAGGIKDIKDAEEFLDLGADRLGTSRIVKAVKALEK
jgi:deoxyribose-phosphate aldolase